MPPETTPDGVLSVTNYPWPVQTTPRHANPPQLTVAASLAAVEGIVIALLGVLEVAAVKGERATMGVTTAVFFVVYGAALIGCAWFVHRRSSWARSPLVLAQLIQVLVGWGFRGGGTTWVTVVSILVALVVLAGLLAPASIEALADPSDD